MNSIKMTIQLTAEQMEGYPVSTESLWFDREGEFFRLKNAPFFIDDLSYDDIVVLTHENENVYKISEIRRRSKNSTVWILIKEENEGKVILNQLVVLGCSVEGGVLNDYFSVNVPESISFGDVHHILEEAQTKDILVTDYPSIRHDS